MDEYYKYIDQLGSSPNPSGDGTLADLKLALSTDNPAEYYPVGTEIEDTYDGHSNPLIVAQYLDSSNNSRYSGAEGVILIRKYVETVSQVFGNSVDYPTSIVKSFLEETYYNSSDKVKSVISNINIQYNNGSSIISVPSKWFLMSAYEVCNKGNGTYEGIMWEFWKQKTGLAAPDNFYTANSGRIVRDRNGTARPIWLRSRNASTNVCIITDSGLVFASLPSNGEGILPACFIAKS